MQPPLLRAIVALVAWMLPVTAVVAQDAKPDSAKPLKVTAGLAYLSATGNTDVTSLTLNERLEWTRPHFLWTQSAKGVSATNNGEESANLLVIGLRGDWKPRGRLSVYGLVNYDRNRFANVGHRFEEGVGLGYALIDRPRHRLTTELGTQLVQQENLEKVSDSFLAGRAAEVYRYTFKESSYLEERLEYLPNLETTEDYRMNGEASLVAPLSRHLAIKLGYLVQFDNLPEPGVKKTDRFFTSGLQVSF